MLKMMMLNLLVKVAKMQHSSVVHTVMWILEVLLAKFTVSWIFQTILSRRFPLSIIIIIIIITIIIIIIIILDILQGINISV